MNNIDDITDRVFQEANGEACEFDVLVIVADRGGRYRYRTGGMHVNVAIGLCARAAFDLAATKRTVEPR